MIHAPVLSRAARAQAKSIPVVWALCPNWVRSPVWQIARSPRDVWVIADRSSLRRAEEGGCALLLSCGREPLGLKFECTVLEAQRVRVFRPALSAGMVGAPMCCILSLRQMCIIVKKFTLLKFRSCVAAATKLEAESQRLDDRLFLPLFSVSG